MLYDGFVLLMAAGAGLNGRVDPMLPSRPVVRGRLEAHLEALGARYVCVDGIEVVRRVLMAVRDVNWGTVPAVVHDRRIEEGADGFRVIFNATNIDERFGIDFEWAGVLTGWADGVVTFTVDGHARHPFPFARIGICVLHPAEFAGASYRARTPGGWIDGVLAADISPQRSGESGLGEPLFPAFSELELVRADGFGVHLELDGDLFELEDQRNWTDASFKAYSTPLHLGAHRQAEPGQRILQSVRISPIGRHRVLPIPRSRIEPIIEIGETTDLSLPSIGLGVSGGQAPLSPREVNLLRTLRPAHLRADIHLGDEDLDRAIDRVAGLAEALAAPLELAVTLTENRRAIDLLARALGAREVPIERVLVFRENVAATPVADVRDARERLGPVIGRVPFFGGTNLLFADLNAKRPELPGPDGIAYPLTPTMHADDDLSLVETIAVHGETVRAARAFCRALPIAVTPITIRQRLDRDAVGTPVDALPPDVDARQPSLLGAVWTFGTANSMAWAGAASLTYYELTGWRGVIETESGAPAHHAFRSIAGMAFPLYHVISDLCEWSGGRLVQVESSVPCSVEAMGVRDRLGGFHLLIANLTPEPVRCEIRPIPAGRLSLRRLEERTYDGACLDPIEYRAAREQPETARGFELAPYALLRMDADA